MLRATALALCLVVAELPATLPAFAIPPATCSLAAPAAPGGCQLVPAVPETDYNAMAEYDPISSRLTLYGQASLIPQTDPTLSWKPDVAEDTITIDRGEVPQGMYTVMWGADPVNRARLAITADPATPSSRVLMLVPDYTFMAYNEAGGASLYTKVDGVPRATVAKDRPQLAKNWIHDPAITPQGFLESQIGAAVDVALQSEIVQMGYRLGDYRLLVLYGHDEYWTEGLRTALETAVSQGSNLLSLSGNTGYRSIVDDGVTITRVDSGSTTALTAVDRRMLAFMQVRYLPAPTYIFVGKKSLTPVRAVTRAKRNGMPKKLSQRAAVARLPLLRVYRPSDPLVAGVVLDKYRFAIRGPGLLGREVDGIPMDRLGKPAAKHRPFINATTQLVAGAFYGTMAQPCATIVRSRKGAGTVISFGTLPWVRSLRIGNPVAQRITANALRELLPPA